MAISYALIGNLRHARQQQAVDREIRRKIAERVQRVDHVADFALETLPVGSNRFLSRRKP